jgi:predicted RNase H-like HicB family nuclease
MPMMARTAPSSRPVLHCYAAGRPGSWEAICLDLDLAVQGESYEEVADSLAKAIRLHLEAVLRLPEEERAQLLHRPVPFSTRLRFALEAFVTGLRRQTSGELSHQYTIAAPA